MSALRFILLEKGQVWREQTNCVIMQCLTCCRAVEIRRAVLLPGVDCSPYMLLCLTSVSSRPGSLAASLLRG